MNRVLITGATGFLGQHCLRPLQMQGFEVHAVHLHTPPPSLADVSWHRVDLLDPAQSGQLAVEVRASHLLHAAWCTEPGVFWTSAENRAWRVASTALAEAFLKAGGRRIVAVGSCAEYDWGEGVCAEGSTRLQPRSVYGQQKVATFVELAELCGHYRAELAWGRIFNLYGPGEHAGRLVAGSIRALLAGREALCTHGEQVRDYLFCPDAAEAFVSLLAGGFVGAVNIASGKQLRIRDLVEAIADTLGRQELVRLGALAAPKDEPALLIADVNRLVNEVRWRPRVTLAEGIRQTISYWRARTSPLWPVDSPPS